MTFPEYPIEVVVTPVGRYTITAEQDWTFYPHTGTPRPALFRRALAAADAAQRVSVIDAELTYLDHREAASEALPWSQWRTKIVTRANARTRRAAAEREWAAAYERSPEQFRPQGAVGGPRPLSGFSRG